MAVINTFGRDPTLILITQLQHFLDPDPQTLDYFLNHLHGHGIDAGDLDSLETSSESRDFLDASDSLETSSESSESRERSERELLEIAEEQVNPAPRDNDEELESIGLDNLDLESVFMDPEQFIGISPHVEPDLGLNNDEILELIGQLQQENLGEVYGFDNPQAFQDFADASTVAAEDLEAEHAQDFPHEEEHHHIHNHPHGGAEPVDDFPLLEEDAHGFPLGDGEPGENSSGYFTNSSSEFSSQVSDVEDYL